MSYTVFARKYRPQTFDEIVGQDHVVKTLKNAIAQNRMAQAYLFVGPRGTGKTTTARIFAKALNCTDGPKADFDPNDPACLEIAEGRSMNVHEFDAASNTQVEKVREIIIDNVKYLPTGNAKYKVYIVDEVHMLSPSSFNALLKTLEEPPAHVKFVFATTNVEKVPTTIISRCQRFDLGRISTPKITAHLLHIARSEQPPLELSPGAAEAIAIGAEGGLRDAESMLDQLVAFCGEKIDEQDVLNIFGFTARQTVVDLCEHLIAGHTAAALAAIHAQSEGGKDLSRLLGDLIEHFRNLLIVQSDPALVQTEMSAEAATALAEQASRISADKLLGLIEQFADAEGRMKWAANKKMHFEIAAIRAIQTLEQASLTEVLAALSALRGGAPLSERPKSPKPPVSVPAPIAPKKIEPAPVAPAAKPSLSATVAASLGESPKITPPPVAKVREEPATKPEPTPIPEAVVETPVAPPAPKASAAPAVSADEIWPALVTRVRKDRALISAWLETGQLVEIADGLAVLAFPPEADLARESCGRANNRSFLEAILTELAGQPLTLKLEKRASVAVASVARVEVKPEPAADPMAEFKNDPLIRKALDVFKAEIIPA